MQRSIMVKLMNWKSSKHRKPLILKGARQVGKTWILKEFGKTYPNGYAYFNFDQSPELKEFFYSTKDIKRIIQNLSLATAQKVDEDTLVIFDEIQECEEALNTLKYFCEDTPLLHVVAAGSLLGITLAKGFPVGKVDFLEMGPMTFTEFLQASGNENFITFMDSIIEIENIPTAFANPLLEKLKQYYIVGGMPECVKNWTEDGDIKEVENALSGIIQSYEKDFAKHPKPVDVPKILYIWKSLPSQLAKENKKFFYNCVKEGARAREYEGALTWLCNADIVKKVVRCEKPGIPISAFDDLTAFKIYLNDIGVLRKLANVSPTIFAESNLLFSEFKGAFSENFVLQSLVRQFEVMPRYWSSQRYEVDFIIQKDNLIIPVEVKSGRNVEAASAKYYASHYEAKTPLVIRYSEKNLSFDGKFLNIPLYLIDQSNKLIELALK